MTCEGAANEATGGTTVALSATFHEAQADESRASSLDEARVAPGPAVHAIDDLLARTEAAPVPSIARDPGTARGPGVASARLVSVQSASAIVRYRGDLVDTLVRIAPEVDRGLLELAARTGESVLVETGADGVPLVIGMLQTRPVGDLLLQATTITLAATKDITLVAGRAALRLRENGHVELVGTRISTISSGVLKLVGRLLRLN